MAIENSLNNQYNQLISDTLDKISAIIDSGSDKLINGEAIPVSTLRFIYLSEPPTRIFKDKYQGLDGHFYSLSILYENSLNELTEFLDEFVEKV